MSPLNQPNYPTTTPNDPDEVIDLSCPECSETLNLRRKHVGIAGQCVHCHAAVTAVENEGVISLHYTNSPHVTGAAPPGEPVESPPAEGEARDPDSQFRPGVPEPAEPAEPAPASPWGFPPHGASSAGKTESRETSPGEASPGEASPGEVSPDNLWKGSAPETDSEEAPSSRSDLPDGGSLESGSPAFAPLPEDGAAPTDREAPIEVESKISGEPAADSPPLFPDIPKSAESTESTERESAAPSSLFASSDREGNAPLFAGEEKSAELNSGWGTKVPNQSHASLSPFSTGSAEADPGFAETLFSEGAAAPISDLQMNSPFEEPEVRTPAFGTGSVLFADPAPSAPAAPGEAEPKPFDGDGGSPTPAAEQEKDAFAKARTEIGDRKKRNPFLLRSVRVFLTLAILGGIGYGAYVFLPKSQVEVVKAKVLKWLEPGSVLLDFLPFDRDDAPRGASGEAGFGIQAIEGLNQLDREKGADRAAAGDNPGAPVVAAPEGETGTAGTISPALPDLPKRPVELK